MNLFNNVGLMVEIINLFLGQVIWVDLFQFKYYAKCEFKFEDGQQLFSNSANLD